MTTYTDGAFGRRAVSLTGSTWTHTLWDGWKPQGEWIGPNHTPGTAPSLTGVHTWF